MSDTNRTVVFNRGKMTYTLRPGPDGLARTLGPGQTIEALDEQEAKDLLDYFDIVDASSMLPATKDPEADRLRNRIRELTNENADLRRRLGELMAKTPAPATESEPQPEMAEEEHKPHRKAWRKKE